MASAFLDTAIVVDLLRDYIPALEWTTNLGSATFVIAPIVWMEVITGAPNQLKQRSAVKVLEQFEIVFLTEEDQNWAMRQQISYRLSRGIGLNDCLIAAPAHRLLLPLYTLNLKHFEPLIGALAVKPY